jgi:hypothetical protein
MKANLLGWWCRHHKGYDRKRIVARSEIAIHNIIAYNVLKVYIMANVILYMSFLLFAYFGTDCP